MKTTQKIATFVVTAFIAVVFLLGNAANAQAKAKPWPVPDKDKALKPSVKLTDASVIATGKELWAKHCKSCHGSKGLGDGPKSASLKTHPGDFSSAAFQAFTDGELFYRTNKGRDEMPAYEKKIPEANDRWALVAFMRTMKK
ncbi:MAG: c-type cytochrome [Bacteroidales bacterium]|jgi:mono/diheme cytochrome c family protein|nr:c-type cytochrome [Bacteroidales bacterium]